MRAASASWKTTRQISQRPAVSATIASRGGAVDRRSTAVTAPWPWQRPMTNRCTAAASGGVQAAPPAGTITGARLAPQLTRYAGPCGVATAVMPTKSSRLAAPPSFGAPRSAQTAGIATDGGLTVSPPLAQAVNGYREDTTPSQPRSALAGRPASQAGSGSGTCWQTGTWCAARTSSGLRILACPERPPLRRWGATPVSR